ncbi:MAG: GlxA family transcriptional regulator [Alphaproteobacteria bacterium]
MTKGEQQESPLAIAFLLVPNFSMMAFTSAIEPLRCANRLSGERLYNWTLISKDGAPVAASNGIAIMPNAAIGDGGNYPTVFVCAGMDVHLYRDKDVFSWLRRLARQGAQIGALCTGSHILARAGLLNGHRCTIHWENIPGFVEEFPDIEITTELFENDRNRLTCSGGTAPLDMMLHMISLRHGYDLAASVSDQFIHDRIRSPNDNQRMALQSRLGVRDAKLLSVISQMEANLEEPLSRRSLAKSVSLSTRQLERLFRKHLNSTPKHYYLELRLRRSRQFLLQTSMSVLGVALACGFVSASHFSKCYREYYGRTPRDERRVAA